MINLKNISKSFGKKTLFNNFDMQINAGDFICIFGASGCGKTTLLNMIGSLELPDSGVVEYNNGKTYTTKKITCIFEKTL